jgi:hypothetical protein
MATKAERFRYDAERTGKPKAAPGTRRGASVMRERQRTGGTGMRNLSNGKKATVEFEDSAHGTRPSRKSTRISGKAHIKQGTPLKTKHVMKMISPRGRKESSPASKRR